MNIYVLSKTMVETLMCYLLYFIGDVDGTVEAILDMFDSYHSDLCRLHLLSYGVGDITDHDIEMAEAFNGKDIVLKTI